MDIETLHSLLMEGGSYGTNWTDAVKANTTTHYSAMDGNLGHRPSVQDTDPSISAVAREEQLQKAQKILPFALAHLPEHYSEVYINLRRSKSALLHSYRDGLLNEAERKLVRSQIKKMTEMIQAIRKMAIDIDSLRM
jgi:hypothetical protein